MKRFSSYKSTLTACFFGYVVQAIVNTFVPLLFVTFQTEYNIPLFKITALIAVNFSLQLCVDLASAFFVDKIGYRACAFFANVLAATGLFLLTVLPSLLPDPFIGILLSNIVYAVGGGLLEVVVSPMVEACPCKHKEKTMSFLHSFYAWGSVAAICLSTLFFAFFGTARWKILSRLWAIIPAANAVLVAFVPVATLNGSSSSSLTVLSLLKNKVFWLLALIIMCGGAAEAAIGQWASAFAEKGLGVSKSAGDLFGPALFAFAMGLGRTLYGKFGHKINLKSAMTISGVLCVAAFLITALAPLPALSLLGMALCGLFVALIWPGTYSLAASFVKGGGSSMFALLALAGDLGCLSGPSLVGCVAGLFGDSLKTGILISTVFPLTLAIALIFFRRKKTPQSNLTENATQDIGAQDNERL